jgi:hypothetical protein
MKAPPHQSLASLVDRWRELSPAELRGCRRNYHRVRLSTPFGFIRLPAPEVWPVDEWDAEARMWCLCDEPIDEVTLWVDYGLQDIPWRSRSNIERIVAAATERSIVEREGWVRHEAEHRSGGRVVAHLFDGEEKGEPLRYWRWNVSLLTERGLLAIFISLVTSPPLHDTPDEKLLVRLYDEAAPICEVGEPPHRLGAD